MKHTKTIFKDFKSRYEAGETQLVWCWHSADLETPLSTYLKLCENKPYTFLLESIEGGTKLGRYSIIGLDPDLVWHCNDKNVFLEFDYGSPDLQNAGPKSSLKSLLKICEIDFIPEGLPPMACSGLFGYMGYAMAGLYEDIPDENIDDLRIPDSILMRPKILAIFDHVKNMVCFVAPVYDHAENSSKNPKEVFYHTQNLIDSLIVKLRGSINDDLLTSQLENVDACGTVNSTATQEEYEAAVQKAKTYIEQGEIFQVVLAQRFEMDFHLPPITLYRSLRRLNPSPFMVHMNFENFALVASSPEIMVRVRDNRVVIRPIAGTRKRGHNEEADKRLAAELLADEKENAEHLMLLDLGRNDVGRVARAGSVTVTDQFIVEYYSHVMHIVSNVEGELQDNMDIIDAHFAGFPAGTVSGAPKIRAMEIIDELETHRRTYYAGSIGYFSGNRMMDTCIALRTALVKDNKLYVYAGAGIVADSDPQSEYEETVNKAKAVFDAAKDAMGGRQG